MLAIARGEYDTEFFADFFFPHYATFPFNEFHHEYFRISNNQVRGYRRAWASPRGSAKSTQVTLIKPIHDVCYGLEKFILIISSTDDLAVGKLKDIRNEVLSNDLLRTTYDLSFESKKVGSEAFSIFTPTSETYFVAKGSGAQIRGIRKGPDRPSKVICDDLEHSERVNSALQRKKLDTYYKEDIGKVGDENTNIELVGTVLHRQSLLAELIKNPSYTSRLYKSVKKWPTNGALWEQWESIKMNIEDEQREEKALEFYLFNKEAMDMGAEVMWPEKEPILHLMNERLEIGRSSFEKEKQNNPLGATDKVFEKIHWYRETPKGIVVETNDAFIPWEHLRHSCYGALDPSVGETKPTSRKQPDFACLLAGYKTPQNRLLVHHDWTQRRPPSTQINELFNMHEKFAFQKVAIETNLFRNLLMSNLVAERNRIEKEQKKLLKLPFYDVVNTENKDKRIYRLEPKVSHGWILFNRALSPEFRGQMEDYPYTDHDDCPDALEMLYQLVNGAYKPSPISLSAM